MSARDIRVSAPGSLMLFGEHAVLRGHPALVCAINRRVSVTLAPRSDKKIVIKSNLGEMEADIETVTKGPPFYFVSAALARRKGSLSTGIDLLIQSELHHQMGLGSSAAVTVAVLAALDAWLNGQWDPIALLRDSVAVIRDVQGIGSGADAAASVFGGVVYYRAEPLEVRRLPYVHPITIVYSGSKMPTAEVVQRVNAAREKHPEIYDALFQVMGRCTEEAAAAIEGNDWEAVGRLMNIHHGLMDALGVCDGKLAGIVYALRRSPGVLGAKISGSGLGDCVIGLGGARAEAFSYDQVPVAMASEGVRREEPSAADGKV